jgi:hypothetical protein
MTPYSFSAEPSWNRAMTPSADANQIQVDGRAEEQRGQLAAGGVVDASVGSEHDGIPAPSRSAASTLGLAARLVSTTVMMPPLPPSSCEHRK